MSQSTPSPFPQLKVSVPASTSNLGPGFDSLGLALSLFLEVRLLGPRRDGVDRHRLVEAHGEASNWPTTEDNALLRAFSAGIERLVTPGEAHRPMDFACESQIPIARGLGSSGAAIVAGLLLARALARHLPGSEDADTPTLAGWAAELEGHPDNTTASLHGGCTMALPLGRSIKTISAPVHSSVCFAVSWPATTVTTSAARAALPAQVPLEDAVENARRLPFLLEGLRTGDGALLAVGLADRLHVQHRLPLIPGGAAALTAATVAGAHGATLSGSGSALIALCPGACAPAVAEAMTSALRSDGQQTASGRVLQLVEAAPRVEAIS